MKPFLTAEWTNIAVISFEADKNILSKYLPVKTELNEWYGKYFISLVGFTFSRPAWKGIPTLLFRRFPEVNLRFYVKYKTKEGWRNGIVFIKEIAPSRIIGLTAKLLYHENYIALPMKHVIQKNTDHQLTEYYWKTSTQWNYIKIRSPYEIINASNSMESFISEHYWGYIRLKPSKTLEFKIAHPPWKIFPAINNEIQLDAKILYGDDLAPFFHHKPLSAFVMDGSYTEVSRPVLI